jgi:hypothetical protein
MNLHYLNVTLATQNLNDWKVFSIGNCVLLHRIWCSQSSGYEDFDLLGYNVMRTDESRTFLSACYMLSLLVDSKD